MGGRDLGQYMTPVWGAEELYAQFFGDLQCGELVVEPSCGTGNFLMAIPRTVKAVGVEIDPTLAAEAVRRTGRRVVVGDFRRVPLGLSQAPAAIVGNPPFSAQIIDGFLRRAHHLLKDGGRVGFVLPAYLFQTASRVMGYAEQWAIEQIAIPRNLFPGLSKALVFGIFTKGASRGRLVGFALYRELFDVLQLEPGAQRVLANGSPSRAGGIWRQAVASVLGGLGGQATLAEIYMAMEGRRPSQTTWWREKVRQTLQRYFRRLSPGLYAL